MTRCTALDVAAYVVERLDSVEPLALQKLVYYCQAWSLAVTDEPAFTDRVEAWRHGPAVWSVYNVTRGSRDPLQKVFGGDSLCVPDKTARVIDLVCQNYGHMRGPELLRRTHREQPWLVARGGIPDSHASNAEITHESMRDFYRSERLGGQLVPDIAAGNLLLVDPTVTVADDDLELLQDEYRGLPRQYPASTSRFASGNLELPSRRRSSRRQAGRFR